MNNHFFNLEVLIQETVLFFGLPG